MAIRSIGKHDVFELRAAKRGGRLSWFEADGETKTHTKLIEHSKEPGVICWHESHEDPSDKATQKATKEDLLGLVHPTNPMSKNHLIVNAKDQLNLGEKRCRSFVSILIEEGILHEWNIPRSGTNALKKIARIPQPAT